MSDKNVSSVDDIKCKNRDFSFKHYYDLIKMARVIGYCFPLFRNFDQFKSREKVLLLRHDVEFKPERAVLMAEIEANLGVTATYFIRVNANDYNPFSYNCYTRIKKIKELGHEIGLHFEAGELSKVTNEDEIDLFLRAKNVLENIISEKILSVSEHADKRSQSELQLGFFKRHEKEPCEILNQAYEEKFFIDLKYISDSNGVWREGCLCGHLGRDLKMQVLTHPYLWYSEHYFIDECVTNAIKRES